MDIHPKNPPKFPRDSYCICNRFGVVFGYRKFNRKEGTEMAQNLSTEDLNREVRAVYANDYRFCESHKGMTYCDRANGHNGKHAAGTHLQMVNGLLWATKIVRW
jgi:hypothetical protein